MRTTAPPKEKLDRGILCRGPFNMSDPTMSRYSRLYTFDVDLRIRFVVLGQWGGVNLPGGHSCLEAYCLLHFIEACRCLKTKQMEN